MQRGVVPVQKFWYAYKKKLHAFNPALNAYRETLHAYSPDLNA